MTKKSPPRLNFNFHLDGNVDYAETTGMIIRKTNSVFIADFAPPKKEKFL